MKIDTVMAARRARRPAALAVALALGAAAAPAAGSPLELFGFGGRSPGLAGAGVADTDDYAAVYLNPSGLAELRRKRLTVGYQLGDIDLDIDGSETPTDRPAARVIGAGLPLPLGGAWKDRVGIGLGFVVPPDSIAKIQAPLPGQPFFALLANRAQVLGIQLATGVRVSPRWRVGAGLLALASLEGFIFIDADGAGRILTVSEQRIIADYAPVLGVGFTVSDRLELGAVARGASQVTFDVKVDNDLASKLPIGLPALRMAGVGQYDPLTVAAEAAYRVSPGLRVMAHLAWQHWSGFPLPTENPQLSGEPQAAPNFHDTVVPRLAGEATTALGPTRVEVRAGYAFVMSPAPEASGRQSFLDNHRHLVSVGLGLAWPGTVVPLHLDLWGQLHGLVRRHHAKDLSLYGADDPAPFEELDASGHIVVAGATVGVDL